MLWRKTAEQGDTTKVASYSKHSLHTEEQFKGRVGLSPTLGETKLTFDAVSMEDEACYTCEFHTFPDGTRSATTCLSVYGETAFQLVLAASLSYCLFTVSQISFVYLYQIHQY